MNKPSYMSDSYNPTVYSFYRYDDDAMHGRVRDWAAKKAEELRKAREKQKRERAARKDREAAEREVTGQNRFDYWLTKQTNRGSGRGKSYLDSATTSEWTPIVDPTEYDTTTDAQGVTRTKSGTIVFKGDPLYFDYSSAIAQYIRANGIPSNWKTLGSHWDIVPIPSSTGVGKDLRQNTAVRQSWIQQSNNSNTLVKLYSINKSQQAYAEQMIGFAKSGSRAVDLAKRTLDVAATSPMGLLLRVFKWQTDIVLGTFEAQIEESIIENNLIRSTLNQRGINVEQRLQELRIIAKDEDWELYDYEDLQRPPKVNTQDTPSIAPNLPPEPYPIMTDQLVVNEQETDITPYIVASISLLGAYLLYKRI